jgi:hypothetical protein
MRFEITRLDPSTHRSDLIPLWRDNLYTATAGKAHLLGRRFEWIYRENPDGPATTWVARPTGGADSMVGCASLYPRLFWFRNEEIPVGTGCDFAVAKDHRVFGPALSLQRSLVNNSLNDGFRFLLVRPDRPSIGLFRRVGYRRYREVERWVKVLRPERYAEDINNSQLVVALSRVAAKGLEALDQAFRAPLLLDLLRTRTEIIDHPDERFDALWAEASSQYTLTEVRSSTYLRWRYDTIPIQRNQFFCLTSRSRDRLLGFVVFSVEDNIVNIEDLFARDTGRSMDCLLVEFIHAMHQEGMSAISVVFLDSRALKTKLKRLFFLKREQGNPLLLFFDPLAPAALKDGISQSEMLMFNGGMDI